MKKEEQIEVSVIENPLKIGKKVAICPIIREGGWLQQTVTKNHDGAFLHSGAKFRIKGTPYQTEKRVHIDPLTPEETAFFESEESGLGISKGDMSIYKKKGYWSNFEVILGREPEVLDLGYPLDYLRYKFLLAQKDIIAPSWDERLDKGTYKYGVKDDDAAQEKQAVKIEKEMHVMDYYAKIRKSSRKMSALLTLYYNTKSKSNKKVPANATMTFLTAEVYKVIKDELDWVYDLIEDKFFDERILITQAIIAGAIQKLSAAEYQIVGEEDVLNLKELLEFLNNNKNQAIRGKIEAQLEIQK